MRLNVFWYEGWKNASNLGRKGWFCCFPSVAQAFWNHNKEGWRRRSFKCLSTRKLIPQLSQKSFIFPKILSEDSFTLWCPFRRRVVFDSFWGGWVWDALVKNVAAKWQTTTPNSGKTHKYTATTGCPETSSDSPSGWKCRRCTSQSDIVQEATECWTDNFRGSPGTYAPASASSDPPAVGGSETTLPNHPG